MNYPVNAAVKVGNILFFGGITPIDAKGQLVGANNLEIQFRKIIDRWKAFLNQAEMDLEDLVFVTVYLRKISFFESMNILYQELIPSPYPARKVLESPMPIDGMVIELSGIASTGKEPMQFE